MQAATLAAGMDGVNNKLGMGRWNKLCELTNVLRELIIIMTIYRTHVNSMICLQSFACCRYYLSTYPAENVQIILYVDSIVYLHVTDTAH